MNPLASLGTVGGLIVGIGGLIVGIGGLIIAWRKLASEVESTTTATATGLMKTMADDIDRLRARIVDLEQRDELKAKRIDELEDGVRVLREQIFDLGHSPVWPQARYGSA